MANEKVSGRRATRYVCSTPYEKCTGAKAKASNEKFCTHSSPEEVLQCHRGYLKSIGYKQLGPRAFETPEGRVQLLAKHPQRAKPGKTDYMQGPHSKKIRG